jgi:hypothetical protein
MSILKNPARLILWACIVALIGVFASRIQNAETITLRAYGVEIRAEGRLPAPLEH